MDCIRRASVEINCNFVRFCTINIGEDLLVFEIESASAMLGFCDGYHCGAGEQGV